MQSVKQAINNSSVQLAVIYVVLIFSTAFGFLSRLTLHFEVFALIIALFGFWFVHRHEQVLHSKLAVWLVFAAFALLAFSRVYPYLQSSVPLGYDPGMYKYAIETPLSQADEWLFQTHEPGFVYLAQFLHFFLPTNIILIWLFIASSIGLGIAIFLCVKEYFGEDSAVFAILIYAISVIQFKAFWYMYYRNIIGMALMLLAFYFLKKDNRWASIITGGLLGAFHRPTFYLFGLSYFFFAFYEPYKKSYDWDKLKTNVLSGIGILAIVLLAHIGRFSQAIFSLIEPVLNSYVNPGEASGTFINFFTYQFSVLPYLVLGLLGFFYVIRVKEISILVFWALINTTAVVFQLLFFNRFIIQLDLALIVFAGLGAVLIISEKKLLGSIIVTILLLSGSILAVKEAINAKPLISEQELDAIKLLSTTPEDSYVMTTNSIYSPWLVGYSGRKTIAPGLFDYNKHDEQGWRKFWSTSNLTETKVFMDVYPKPLFVFIGQQQRDSLAQFPECFEIFSQGVKNHIYKYTC